MCFLADVTEYVKYLKLAVAVAVIRSRPVGMTGQRYAEQLCARYQQAQLGWKQEADRLKQQLNVILQQKPLLGRLVVTTVLRPFFRDHPGEPVPEENFWTLWCKGRLTEADKPIIRLGATPS